MSEINGDQKRECCIHITSPFNNGRKFLQHYYVEGSTHDDTWARKFSSQRGKKQEREK